jgi:hypothetical protein
MSDRKPPPIRRPGERPVPACPVLARGDLDPGGPSTVVGGTHGRELRQFYAGIVTARSTTCEPCVNTVPRSPGRRRLGVLGSSLPALHTAPIRRSLERQSERRPGDDRMRSGRRPKARPVRVRPATRSPGATPVHRLRPHLERAPGRAGPERRGTRPPGISGLSLAPTSTSGTSDPDTGRDTYGPGRGR